MFPDNDPDGSTMLCRMPVVGLPEDLSQQLNNSETGTIANTEGPGVAVYWASDRSARADIYIGLVLDGFTRYTNISSVNDGLTRRRRSIRSAVPTIKMQFSLPPDLYCAPEDDLDFSPLGDKVISIQVNRRL